MASRIVIAVTGLKSEARIAERSKGVTAIVGGGRDERVSALLQQSVRDGVRGIISFGIAGGLRPGLKPGTLVIGTSVIHSSGRTFAADVGWSDRLFEALPNAESGPVAGSGSIIADPAEKRAIYLASGAFAADMESHLVAQFATDSGIPFAVLRAIADPADQGLPPAAVNGLNPDGTPNVAGVLKALVVRPGQIWDVIRIAGATHRAMRGLLRCHGLLGPGLGCADLGELGLDVA